MNKLKNKINSSCSSSASNHKTRNDVPGHVDLTAL